MAVAATAAARGAAGAAEERGPVGRDAPGAALRAAVVVDLQLHAHTLAAHLAMSAKGAAGGHALSRGLVNPHRHTHVLLPNGRPDSRGGGDEVLPPARTADADDPEHGDFVAPRTHSSGAWRLRSSATVATVPLPGSRPVSPEKGARQGHQAHV